MARRHWLILLGLAALLALPLAAQDKKKDGVDDLLDGIDKGTKYRLAPLAAPERNLVSSLYWRTLFGTVAAQTTPIRFHVEGTDIIAPVLNPTGGSDGKAAYTYPIEGQAKLKPGKYTLKPGNIPFEIKGTDPSSSHAAFKVEKGEVRILCAPVRLDIVDERGVPAPGSIRLFDEKDSLLREEARFSVLTVWLPIGGEYQTSLGSFTLTADGKIKAGKLAAGVSVTTEGLRKTVPAPAPTKTAVVETITLSGAKEGISCRAFVPAMVKPGERLSVAVSRREYQQMSGRAFTAADVTVQVEDAAAKAGQEGQFAETLRDQAASALRTTVDDLGTLSVPLPANVAGPVGVMVQVAGLGSARATVLVADAGKVMVVPHRWRTVFACSETAVYQLLLPRGSAAGEAKVLLQTEKAKEGSLIGKLTLPAVDGDGDARLFTVKMADVPLGRHALVVETPAGRTQVPLMVVSDAHLSSFFTHSISGCTTCWPTSDEGLDVLQKAGLEMVSATGASSLLDTHLPQIDRNLAARLQELGLPAEAALHPAADDRLLQRLLAHRLRLVDLTVVRDAGMYNEGLSYHHSYQPSVDRMVRRMQLFTQQTADYPSFWGVNYSWFPALFGYVEGGVPTDAHVADRNRTLLENVRKAGFPPLTREESDWVRKQGGDPANADKTLSLIGTAIAHRNAVQDRGWAKHNALYNQAVHQVRPDVVCTLFENAGHDEGKRLRSMYHAMNAQCYESYTDYGDWPMSAAFVTDWSHGQSPGQPVWLTTCWGTSSEGKMKSLFHAFARGLEGGGVPMEGNFELAELARRGTGLRFVSQYGGLSGHAAPDRRVAILARSAHQVFGRLMWDCHATYYYLTRLGYPPVMLADDEVKKTGLPAAVQVLMLVKEELPLEPETRQAIEAFQKRGGKVIAVGCTVPVAGAIEVKEAPKHLWELKGFHPDSHTQMWQEFEKTWRTSLGDALTKTGVSAAARTDPTLGLAVGMDAGPVRYVAVIADLHGTHSNHFEPTSDMPLSLEGAGWKVRDLVKQKDLATTDKDGRTATSVELRTEPTTLLALYRSAPAAIKIELAGEPHLGSELIVRCAVSAADRSDLGAVPVSLTLIGPDGVQREKLFRAAGDVVRFPLPARDLAGKWSLTIQELLTGVSATTEINPKPAANPTTVTAVTDVHVVNAAHLKQFVARPGERLVIVEPEQAHLLPLAQKLTDDLKSAGVAARLWQVRPEEYDTHPVRWYPTSADEQRLADIEAGKLIGVRENLLAYIDKVKRAHVPERGGYSESQPPYMVGRDCIVFSGGRLAESLRAVSPWLETPHVPGRGQGRLVVCFSPFLANRHAVAVVGNDIEGLGRAAGELAAAFQNKAATEKAKPEENLRGAPSSVRAETLPVPTPFAGFTPLQRVVRLLANAEGQAAVLLNGKQDNVALVDGAGRLTAAVKLDLLHAAQARLDTQGQLQLPVRKVTATHPGWGFPTEAQVRLLAIAPDGQLKRELLAYTGSLDVPDFEGGLLWSQDGTSTALGRAGGMVFQQGSPEWRRYDDVPHVRSRFGLLCPRHPVGAVLSADGRYLLFTMDSRTPFGGLGSPTPRPTGCETVLLDLKTGERVWALAAKDRSKSTYAIHTGFGALSRDATVAAFADHEGAIHLVDRSGKVLLSEKVTEESHDAGSHQGPPDGVGVWLSETGRTAVFGFRRQLVIVSDKHVERLKIDGLTSAAVSADSSLIVAGCGDGKVRAFDPAGKQLWEATPRGAGPLVAAAGAKGFLVATGDGDLVLLDRDGKEVRRTSIAATADKETHELKPAADVVRPTPPTDYVEPPTLALARKQLGAKEVDAWKPSGAGKQAFGRSFHILEGKGELSGGAGEGEFFVHLVYRRPATNKSLRILTNGKDGPETFWLDLPTPEYRVIDIPVRGPKAQVTLLPDGPVEVAELSLWSLRWPGPNMAYVRPAGIESKPSKEPSDDILGELDGKKSVSGKLKECRVWWPNTDPDAVRGPYLPAPVDPLQMVDGKRFGGGKTGAWANQDKGYQPTRGGFFTVNFGDAQEPTLLATCDRADRQSAVCVNLAAFVHDGADALQGGTILAGVVGNDQFWRLVPLKGEKVKVLGVHVIKDATSPAGLSEVEVYK